MSSKSSEKNVNIELFLEHFKTLEHKIPYEKGNIVHIYMKIRDFKLFKSKFQSINYDRNRPVDDQRVETIRKKYEDNYSKFRTYTFFGQIILGLVQGSDPRILDGQHRLSALEKISEDSHEFMIVIINYDSEADRFEGFTEINSNLSLPDMYKFSNEETKKIAGEITESLVYNPIFKPYLYQKEQNGNPSINKTKLIEKLCEILPTIKEFDRKKLFLTVSTKY